MVDFKYHLVSLMSVFLALAVGIILGAGPLQGTIGNQLTGQVNSLRASRDSLRSQLDDTRSQLDTANQALVTAGTELSADVLKGKRVGFAVLPDASDDDLNAVQKAVTQAGGSVSGVVSLTDDFANPSSSSYRSTIASSLTQYVKGVPGDASPARVLGAAVAQTLRGDPKDAGVASILATLSSGDHPLIQNAGAPKAQADIVVLVAPSLDKGDAQNSGSKSSQGADQKAAATQKSVGDLYAEAYSAISATGPSVAVGGGDGDVLAAIRSGSDGSTVDSLGTSLAPINVVLAAGHELKGDHVKVGQQQGASALVAARPDGMPAANGGGKN